MNHLSPATRLLTRLAAAPRPIAHATLAAETGLSCELLTELLATLRGYGYMIENQNRSGYQLIARPNAAVPPEVEPWLVAGNFGLPYHYLATTPSTNTLLAGMARDGTPPGTLVVAEEQTAGRGRMIRPWHSPAGHGLYLSLLLAPTVALAQVTTLPLVVGLAVADTIAALLPDASVAVKWPNDIWLNGAKVGGILCEMQETTATVQRLIVGIGLNVNQSPEEIPEALRPRATSLAIAAGAPLARATLLLDLLRALEARYNRWLRDGFEALMDSFAAVDALAGRTITIERPNDKLSGIASGVDANGALRLRTTSGAIETIYSGEAHISNWGTQDVGFSGICSRQ